MSRHRRRQKTNRKAPAPLRRSDTPGVHPPEAPRPRLEPLDDIPDLPVTPQGAFELPTAPSGDLPPETREWVSRFLPTLGPGMSPGAGPDDGFEPVDEPATPSEPAPAPSPVSPSASAPTPAAAPARQAPAVSVTAARAHAPPVALAPAAAAEATPAVVAATPRFTLEVATFIFEDRAQAERDRLAAAGHEVSVRSEGQDSSRVYRVLLG